MIRVIILMILGFAPAVLLPKVVGLWVSDYERTLFISVIGYAIYFTILIVAYAPIGFMKAFNVRRRSRI